MAGDTAFITQFRDEFVAGFEQRQSWLKTLCNSDVMTKGNQATWDIVDSGGAVAVTRGVNGLIPRGTPNENQITVTLTEWHFLATKTSFNIFASQGDGRKKLHLQAEAALNRRIDDDLISALNTAPNAGIGGPITLAMVQQNLAKLGRQDIEIEDEDKIVMVASIAARDELYQLQQFTSHDYVDVKPLTGPVRRMLKWAGCLWMFSNRLPGVGTNSETMFMLHRDALGHACNTNEVSVIPGYNEEQDYSFARSTMYMGSTVLQSKGILKIPHDGSAIG